MNFIRNICCLLLIFFIFDAQANRSVKLAIFDNPQVDSSNALISQQLQNSYMQGINIGLHDAKKQKIDIQYKVFFYGDNLLNIIQEAPNVTSWNPDIIMGLHSSNESLMSRTFFTDRQVLSISATDIQLANLPLNFYSLGVPDPYAAKAIIKFIKEHYPGHNLFIAVGAESKESVDLGNLLASDYQHAFPKNTVIISKFLSSETSSIDLPDFMNGYKTGDLIVTLSIAGTYDEQINLMNQIANYLAPNKLIFINDVDNWGTNVLPSSYNNTVNSYTAYRLDTLFFDKKSVSYKNFSNSFKSIYHTSPTDKISFLTYQTIMSFVAALKKYPPPNNLTTIEAILWSYAEARKYNPNWFRPMEFAFYKMEPYQETLYEKVLPSE